MLFRIALLSLILCLPTPANLAIADDGARPATKVWRIVTYRIKPGGAETFWNDLREHAKPMFEIGIRDGFLTEYKVMSNPYRAGPDDWDVMLLLGYPDYASFDTFPAKARAAYLEHFGSDEAAQENAAGRDAYREVLAIRLVQATSLE